MVDTSPILYRTEPILYRTEPGSRGARDRPAPGALPGRCPLPPGAPGALQCSCLENPRDGRAWRAAVYPTLQGPCDQSQKWRRTLRFLPPLEMRPDCRRLRGRGCANCQSLPQAELFVRQRERPGLHSQPRARPPLQISLQASCPTARTSANSCLRVWTQKACCYNKMCLFEYGGQGVK